MSQYHTARWSNLWHALTIKKTPTPWRRLWGTALTTTLGLVIGFMAGNLEWGIMAFMGGFASLYVQNQPYRTRAITLALVGLGLGIAMALGALSTVWWAMALALALVATASTYFAGAFDVPLPAGFMFVLIACISAALPVTSATVLEDRIIFVLIGAGLAWLIGMSDWIWNRRGPVASPVSRAYRMLSQYVAKIGTNRASDAQYQATLALTVAHRAVLADSGHDRRIKRLAAQAETVLRSAIALSSRESQPLPKTWSTLLESVSHHVAQVPQSALTMPTSEPSHNHLIRRWESAMHETVALTNGQEIDVELPEIHQVSASARLKRALSMDSLVLPATLRIGIAVALSVVIAHIFGIAHPFWVPLTCAAVLQGVSTVIITQRTVQRAIGTTVGLMLTAAILAFRPSSVETAVLVVLLQLLMLLFIAKNYGLSVVFITSLALVIIYSGTHPAVMPMVWARFVDTLLGATIGFLAALLLWGQASSKRLPVIMADALQQSGRLFGRLLQGSSQHSVSPMRARAISRLLTVRLLFDTAMGELPKADMSEKDWSLALSVERIGYLVVALCDNLRPQDQTLAEQVGPIFDALGEAIRGNPPDALPQIPHMGRYDAIESELYDLADLLGLPDSTSAAKTS